MAMAPCRLLALAGLFCCVLVGRADAQDTDGFAGPGDDVRLEPARTLDSEQLFSPPSTRQQWNERRESLRRRVLVAAGLWPRPQERPLSARITGSIERDGYVVQHVAFESLPGFHVTGNLYRPVPAPSGRVPGVLCPHGHWDQGRF